MLESANELKTKMTCRNEHSYNIQQHRDVSKYQLPSVGEPNATLEPVERTNTKKSPWWATENEKQYSINGITGWSHKAVAERALPSSCIPLLAGSASLHDLNWKAVAKLMLMNATLNIQYTTQGAFQRASLGMLNCSMPECSKVMHGEI